jgi:hypothetical protein
VGTNIIQGRVYMENAGTGVLSLSTQSVTNVEGQFMFVSQTATPTRTQITLTPTVVSGTGETCRIAALVDEMSLVFFVTSNATTTSFSYGPYTLVSTLSVCISYNLAWNETGRTIIERH